MLPLSDDVALVFGDVAEFFTNWIPSGRTKYCFIPIIWKETKEEENDKNEWRMKNAANDSKWEISNVQLCIVRRVINFHSEEGKENWKILVFVHDATGSRIWTNKLYAH